MEGCLHRSHIRGNRVCGGYLVSYLREKESADFKIDFGHSTKSLQHVESKKSDIRQTFKNGTFLTLSPTKVCNFTHPQVLPKKQPVSAKLSLYWRYGSATGSC